MITIPRDPLGGTVPASAPPMSDRAVIGIVGAGQLALMMFEASLRLDLEIRVLGAHEDDPALRVVPHVSIGDPRDIEVLRRFAAEVDVLTFDHELIDVAAVVELERDGRLLRPGSKALAVATDKRLQHLVFEELGIDAPMTQIAEGTAALRAVAAASSLPVVIKHASGGYDGRGVHIISRGGQLEELIERLEQLGAVAGGAETFVVQPCIGIDAEVAVQVVRSPDGEIVTYPVVRTVQEDGICRMVQIPAGIPDELCVSAVDAAVRLAERLDVVGVLAVEFFVSEGRLLANEIATRPHNSGHITIESSVTSQFENHLRAVAGLPLGATDLVVPAASMVNIIGSRTPPSLAQPNLPGDASVHLYGKAHRPGRKLGHVTAVGRCIDEVTDRARRAAGALEHQGADA